MCLLKVAAVILKGGEGPWVRRKSRWQRSTIIYFRGGQSAGHMWPGPYPPYFDPRDSFTKYIYFILVKTVYWMKKCIICASIQLFQTNSTFVASITCNPTCVGWTQLYFNGAHQKLGINNTLLIIYRYFAVRNYTTYFIY